MIFTDRTLKNCQLEDDFWWVIRVLIETGISVFECNNGGTSINSVVRNRIEDGIIVCCVQAGSE